MNEAIRDWIANVETTHYLIGSAAGPHPYPTLVRELQSVIGREARAQMLRAGGPAAGRRRRLRRRRLERDRACSTRSATTTCASSASRRAATAPSTARRLDRRRPRLGAARLALLRALRREGPGLGEPLDLGRPRLSGRRPRARLLAESGPRRVRARERRRGARGVPPPVPARGHHPGARVVATRCYAAERLARELGPDARRAWSASRGAATRTSTPCWRGAASEARTPALGDLPDGRRRRCRRRPRRPSTAGRDR